MCGNESENVYEDFYKDKELFDFSKYSKDLKYYDKTYNLVFGKMKDETCGVPIKCFVGSKVDMYTYITEGEHEWKKAKGIDS